MTPTRKRGRPAKSSFYHVRWNRIGINQQRAANVLGVTIAEIEEFDRNGNRLAERYLLLWDKKHVNIEGWNGWHFSRGTLRFHGMQWRPENIINDRHFRESLESEARQLIQSLSTQ